MSHATVLIRIANARLAKATDLKTAIAEMMAPYEEETDDPRFVEFDDEESSLREEYETGSRDTAVGPTGDMVSPFDERFRVEGERGAFGAGQRFEVSAPYVTKSVPFKERYSTFEEFCSDWHGYTERDPKTKRYGRWHNPNKTWDWYQVGGRWADFFPVKPGRGMKGERSWLNAGAPAVAKRADIVRRDDIDMDEVARLTRERAEDFWEKFVYFRIHGKECPVSSPFGGARASGLHLGLVRVVTDRTPDPSEGTLVSWSTSVGAGDSRAKYFDVISNLTREEFDRDYFDAFNPIVTYAALDDDGWHAPGKMGWFGCSSDEPDGYLAFKRDFMKRFIKAADPTDTLVVVDYHI